TRFLSDWSSDVCSSDLLGRGEADRTVNTYAVKAGDIESAWWVVDAADETLGRLASRIAALLQGKHKPTYSPHLDAGDHVVVVNEIGRAACRVCRYIGVG